MPRTLEVTPQEIADTVRDTIVATFDAIMLALHEADQSMTVGELVERLGNARPELEAGLVHALDQKAAAFREQR